jgi:hypothetical protein
MRIETVGKIKRIGLKGKVLEKIDNSLIELVKMSYSCDYGYAVLYGGFKNNKLKEDLIFVDYAVDKCDIVQDGHTVVPLYVIQCSVSELAGKALGDVEEIIEREIDNAYGCFSGMYGDADVTDILKCKYVA